MVLGLGFRGRGLEERSLRTPSDISALVCRCSTTRPCDSTAMRNAPQNPEDLFLRTDGTCYSGGLKN